jgi:hypothetical protein
MSEPQNLKPAALVEGFGAPAFGAHIFRVDIPAAAKGDVTIVEDYGLKGGENGIPPREARVVLPRRFWSAVAETARKDFVARLKAKKLAGPRWAAGDNKVDRMLGKELCVLAWAAEQASSVDECKAIAAKWAALKPEERWWFFSKTVAEAGMPDDRDAGWRKALYFALSSGKVENKRLRAIRPEEDGPTTPQLF